MNANKLRGKMAENGFTQKALAAIIGKSENSLSRKLRGKTPFNTDEIMSICDALHIDSNAEKASIFFDSCVL